MPPPTISIAASSTPWAYDPNTRIPGYGITTVNVGIGDPDGKWRFGVYARNLFDTYFVSAIQAKQQRSRRLYQRAECRGPAHRRLLDRLPLRRLIAERSGHGRWAAYWRWDGLAVDFGGKPTPVRIIDSLSFHVGRGETPRHRRRVRLGQIGYRAQHPAADRTGRRGGSPGGAIRFARQNGTVVDPRPPTGAGFYGRSAAPRSR